MHRLILLVSCLLGAAIPAQAALVAVLDSEISVGAKGIIETLREVDAHEIKVIVKAGPHTPFLPVMRVMKALPRYQGKTLFPYIHFGLLQ